MLRKVLLQLQLLPLLLLLAVIVGRSVHAQEPAAASQPPAAVPAPAPAVAELEILPPQSSLVVSVGAHSGPIRRLAVDPQGRTLVTASDDKTALVWDLAEGRARAVLRVPIGTGDIGRLYGVAIDPTARTVAVVGTTAAAGGRHRIHVFELESGAFVRAFDAHGGDVKRMAWSLDGQFLAAVYAGSPALRVFDAAGALWAEQALPADSYGLSTSVQGLIAVTTMDHQVRLYRFRGGRLEDRGSIRTGAVDPVSVRHSPDGRWIAVGYFSPSEEPITGRKRAAVDIYNTTTRALERSIDVRDLGAGNLMSVAWQHDGSAIYAGGTGHAGEGRYVVARLPWPQGEPTRVAVAGDSIQDLAPMPDGGMVYASYDGTWGVLDATGTLQRRYDAAVKPIAQPQWLRISTDARRVSWRRGLETPETLNFALDRRELTVNAAASGNAAASANAAAKVATNAATARAPENEGLLAPVESDPAVVVANVRNGLAPTLNRAPIPMLPGEIRGPSLCCRTASR